MQIDFQSSGSFANLQPAYRVDTRTLWPGEASELEALMRQSHVMEMQLSQLASNPTTAQSPATNYTTTLVLTGP